MSGLCHSRSFPGTLSDAAAGLLYLHQDTCSARLRLYSNTPTASLLHLKHRITLVASCHIGLECHDEDWGLKFSLRPISMVICCNCCVRIYAVRHTATDNRRMISTSQSWPYVGVEPTNPVVFLPVRRSAGNACPMS